MPIKTTIRNTEHLFKNIFNTGEPLDEELRDKSKDYIHKEVVRPEKSISIDFETFEHYIQKLIETDKMLNKEYSGRFGNDLINFVSEVNTPFYTLKSIIFTNYDDERISEFVNEGYVQYWEENYFENKYGQSDSYLIKPEDYNDEIKIDTIKGLYDFLKFTN